MIGAAVFTPARTGLEAALGVVELIVFASWVLMFVLLFALWGTLIVRRGRSQRRGATDQLTAMTATADPAAVAANAARVQPGLQALREADPRFDPQLLLDAARTATLLIFVALSTGDEIPIGRLTTEAFWATPFGQIVRLTAGDRRRERIDTEKDVAAGRQVRQWKVPLDYQASVPELVAVTGGPEHHISVRVFFSQLEAVVRPGARAMTAGAAATSLQGAAAAFAGSFAAQAASDRVQQVSWLSAKGRYDLMFVRSGNASTDPGTALADRTCAVCGAAYRSELAVACSHCGTERRLPWGHWRLARAEPVR
jgi:hypothetical protein